MKRRSFLRGVGLATVGATLARYMPVGAVLATPTTITVPAITLPSTVVTYERLMADYMHAAHKQMNAYFYGGSR